MATAPPDGLKGSILMFGKDFPSFTIMITCRWIGTLRTGVPDNVRAAIVGSCDIKRKTHEIRDRKKKGGSRDTGCFS